jgi:formylglycine-generating enzyme required for sulfatase activity
VRASLCALFAALGAGCFPDYSFSAADAATPDAANPEGGDASPPDATIPTDAAPDAAPLDAAPSDATDGGIEDTAPPGDSAPSSPMVSFEGGAFDFVVNTVPAIHATLDYDFAIDAEEVTIARFLAWVDAGMPVPCTGSQPCALDTKTPYRTAMYWDPAWNTIAKSSDYMGASAGCQTTLLGDIVAYEQPDAGGYAVTCVNWAQAVAFCAWDKRRLPTTTEWYYVATGKGVNASDFPWGDAMPDCTLAVVGNLGNPCAYPVAAGTTRAQIPGVYDLIGDVAEWTWDSIDPNLSYPPDATDYVGLPVDGGIAGRNTFQIYSAYSTNLMTLDSVASTADPRFGSADVGFRCAKTL